MADLLVDFDNLAVIVFESSEAPRGGQVGPRMPCCVIVCLALPFDLEGVSRCLELVGSGRWETTYEEFEVMLVRIRRVWNKRQPLNPV